MKRDATLPSHLHICFSSCSIQFNFINPQGGNWFKGKKSVSDNKIRDTKMDSLWGRLRKRCCVCVLRNFVWRPEWSLHCVNSFLKGAQNLFPDQLLQSKLGFTPVEKCTCMIYMPVCLYYIRRILWNQGVRRKPCIKQDFLLPGKSSQTVCGTVI